MQTSSGNHVAVTHQQSLNSATATTNTLTIVQDSGTGAPNTQYGENNWIGDITQHNTSAGTSAGLANSISIGKHGGGRSLGNRVFVVSQTGATDSLGIEQDGQLNVVTTVTQNGSGDSASVTRRTATRTGSG